MEKSFIKKIIAPIPLLLMLYIIFFFSGQPGETSGGLSGRVCEWILHTWCMLTGKVLNEVQTEAGVEFLQPIVRKCAHMAEYFLLTGCVYLPISIYTLKERYILATETSVYALAKQKSLFYHRTRSHSINAVIRILLTIGITVLFAAADELHQYFVPGRTGCLRDVGIDSIGIILASLILYLFCKNDN